MSVKKKSPFVRNRDQPISVSLTLTLNSHQLRLTIVEENKGKKSGLRIPEAWMMEAWMTFT